MFCVRVSLFQGSCGNVCGLPGPALQPSGTEPGLNRRPVFELLETKVLVIFCKGMIVYGVGGARSQLERFGGSLALELWSFIEFLAKSVCGKVSCCYQPIRLWMALISLMGSKPAPTFDLWSLSKHPRFPPRKPGTFSGPQRFPGPVAWVIVANWAEDLRRSR